MATFNGEEWLDTQLHSIAEQIRLPEQLIISDDGSTDGTVEIAHTFARDAPFDVVVLEGPRVGNGENFWSAAKHANTDIIAWCDQDDFWYPKKLQICERLMEANKVQFLSHSAVVTDAALVPTGRLFPNYRRTRIIEPLKGDPWWVAPGFTTLVSTAALQSVRWEDRPLSHFLNGRHGHDDVIALLAFTTGRRLEVSDTLASYRQHSRNLAGAPKIQSPLEQVKYALSIEPAQYSDRAAFAEGYGRFIAACDPQNTQAIDYWCAIEARCLRRSKIHQSPNRLSGARNVFVALGKGDFGHKSHGGFGGLALARDAVALILGANHHPI
jgi:hypothetical protein